MLSKRSKIVSARAAARDRTDGAKRHSGIDVLSKIPSTKAFSVNVAIHLQREPLTREVGNPQKLSAIEKFSDDSRSWNG
jgi:hypothetical protein